MKYDLTKAEHKRLADFLKRKMSAAMHDSAYFDSNLPTWYKHVEKIHAKMVAKPEKLQLSLLAWEVYRLNTVRDIDVEFPELNSFLEEEVKRLLDIGKLPDWLKKH